MKSVKRERSSHKSKEFSLIIAYLQLIYIDLFGPVHVMSLSKKKYALVMVDDFSRYNLGKVLSLQT